MDEFDDDDCSDLYADVVVQASSAISAMHRLTEMRHVEDKIFDNATRREKEVRDGFRGRSQKTYEHVSECENEEEEGGGGGLTNLPLENGDISLSESEDDLDSGSEDEYKQKKDENYESDRHDDRASDVEFEVINGNSREGGPKYEEDEKRRGGIDAKKKSSNDGDHNSQIKSLKYDFRSSKKNRVDKMACNAHKSCNKRDEELFSKRDVENNQSRPNDASGSCRPSVQISDSVEDNHHEVSNYSSDGMTMETSKDTNRRNQSSPFNKVSSSTELESSESGRSQRGRGSSCSPSPRGDNYIGKSHKYSRHPSSSLDRELQEEITQEYHPSKNSKSRVNKRATSYGRYCDRQRGDTRNHSHQQRKSSDVPYLKNRWTNGDASYSIDVARPFTRNVKHGKQRAMNSFESSRNDMPYHSHSERFFTHSSRFLPDYRMGPAYLKNQYPDIHPSCRYKQNWSDDLNMSERQIFIEKKINKMDYEASGDDWHHNQMRCLDQANVKGSRKLTPKYSAVNQRGTQFSYEVDDMQFRRRAKDDYLSPLHESDNKYIEGKHRRMGPTSGRDRDHLDHIYDRNITSQTSGRGKRRHDSSHNSLDNLWYTETDLNDGRNNNGRPFPFFSPEESYAPRRGQYPGSSGPKSGVSERNMRCLWKEQHVENGQYGIDIASSDTIESLRYRSEDHLVRRRHYQQFSDTYFMNESIKDDYEEDNFFRRRHHQRSEVLHSREDSRHQGDAIFHSERPFNHFEKISKNNRADDRRAFGHIDEHIDDREANRERTKMIREQDPSNRFDGYHKSVQPHSHAQMHPRYKDSIGHLVVVGRKCPLQYSTRTPEAGDDKYYNRRDLTEWNSNQKLQKIEDSNSFHSKNAVLTNEEKVDISPGDKNQHDQSLDIEEGQIISEEIQDRMKRIPPSEGQQPLVDEKIREIMVKMEKRKMRFKEPVTPCRDSSVKGSYLLPDLNVESDMTKLKRPSRKRRWCGT